MLGRERWTGWDSLEAAHNDLGESSRERESLRARPEGARTGDRAARSSREAEAEGSSGGLVEGRDTQLYFLFHGLCTMRRSTTTQELCVSLRALRACA